MVAVLLERDDTYVERATFHVDARYDLDIEERVTEETTQIIRRWSLLIGDTIKIREEMP